MRAATARWLANTNRVVLRFFPEASGRPAAVALDRSKQPALGADKRFQAPEVKSAKLANGMDVLVVERRDAPQRAPAAHVVNARTFEILRAAGVDMQAVAAACQDPADAGAVLWVTTLVGDELGRLSFEKQGDEILALTPTPLRNLSQHELEPILLEQLRGRANAVVRFANEWESSAQDADGVTSRVRDLANGAVSELRTRWVRRSRRGGGWSKPPTR